MKNWFKRCFFCGRMFWPFQRDAVCAALAHSRCHMQYAERLLADSNNDVERYYLMHEVSSLKSLYRKWGDIK